MVLRRCATNSKPSKALFSDSIWYAREKARNPEKMKASHSSPPADPRNRLVFGPRAKLKISSTVAAKNSIAFRFVRLRISRTRSFLITAHVCSAHMPTPSRAERLHRAAKGHCTPFEERDRIRQCQ